MSGTWNSQNDPDQEAVQAIRRQVRAGTKTYKPGDRVMLSSRKREGKQIAAKIVSVSRCSACNTVRVELADGTEQVMSADRIVRVRKGKVKK